MKSYTDLEQSKKLAEILSFETADMCYIKHSSSDNSNWEFNEDFPPMILGNVHINEITAETLPCWSLAALLNVLPLEIEMHKQSDGNIKYYYMEYTTKKTYFASKRYTNPVDAAFEMIYRLKENGNI